MKRQILGVDKDSLPADTSQYLPNYALYIFDKIARDILY